MNPQSFISAAAGNFETGLYSGFKLATSTFVLSILESKRKQIILKQPITLLLFHLDTTAAARSLSKSLLLRRFLSKWTEYQSKKVIGRPISQPFSQRPSPTLDVLFREPKDDSKRFIILPFSY